MKKSILIGLFAIFSAIFAMNTYASDVRLIIDDQEVSNLPTPPMLVNNNTMVPARAVFEHMGGVVGWHSGHRQISIFMGNDILVLTVGSTTALLNGVAIQMSTPPIIVGDSTMIPLRFPAEAFGFYVYWDRQARAAIINTNGESTNGNNGGSTPQPPSELPIISIPRSGNNYVPDDTKNETPGSDLPVNNNLARNISSSPITTIAHPQTTITNVLTPSDIGTGAYVIVASSPISEINYFVLDDNRLVVDIHNAITQVSGNIATHGSVPLTGARIAQNTPIITRVVFEVIDAVDFSISLSADRTALTIAFAPNNITNVFLQSDDISDSLFIQGNTLPAIRICTEGFPNYLTVNIDNANMLAGDALHSSGIFASHFATGQRADGSAYIRIFVGDNWPTFSVAHGNNAVVIMLHHALTGIRYDSARRELHISRATGFAVDIAQVVHIDDYLRLQYTLALPHAAPMLGRGELSIMDGYINSVTLLQGENGNAQLVFDTERVLTFSIHETAESYIIRAHLPREVRPFIVVIDPGHGGWCPGTEHNGVRERDLVLSISHMVMQLIDANPFITGFMTRNDNTGVENLRRAEFANELNADLFVSIHANAAEHPNRTINPNVDGIETWYNLSNSGNHSLNSRQFAEILQRNLIADTGARNRGLRYGAGLIVVRETYMPAALVEVGFLTNPQEAARLATTAYQWQIARAIYNSIVETFHTFPPA